MRSFAGERPPPPIASAPSSSDRRLKGHRDLREAASPQRIRLAPPWESYNRTATGFAPLTISTGNQLLLNKLLRLIPIGLSEPITIEHPVTVTSPVRGLYVVWKGG